MPFDFPRFQQLLTQATQAAFQELLAAHRAEGLYSFSHLILLGSLAAVGLGTSACHPDQPATQPTTADQAATKQPVALPEAAAPRSLVAGSTDTLHLPGGVVAQLRPSTAAAFSSLPADTVADAYSTTPEQFAAAGLRVRRRGLALRLQPTAGPLVVLSSVPDAQFTLQNSKAVRYQYLGSLPSVHQWVVRANYWESDATVLVDQRTGRHLEQPGRPFAAPDGRHLLLCSPGLGGGDQANMLSLIQIAPTGPRLLWQLEPSTWEPAEARWVAPNRVVLRRRHTRPDGSLPADARVTYDELTVAP